jgi:hypothetical protein
MKADKQRIAIAEACRWTREYADVPTWDASLDSYKGGYTPVRTLLFRRREKCVMAGNLPDYLTDLNAMHEAEKMLTREQMDTYAQWVYSIVARDGARMTYGIAAPAAQRAEAFLRALNLWQVG